MREYTIYEFIDSCIRRNDTLKQTFYTVSFIGMTIMKMSL